MRYNAQIMSWNKIPIKPTAQRLLEKVRQDKETGCWIWTAARKKPEGYGFFWMQRSKKNEYAHRVSYELFTGQIPKGMVVCHTCDNPPCINPAHLFIGTVYDNRQDCIAKGRDNVGERGGLAKLTNVEAREIFMSREPAALLAARYKVSHAAIWNIWTKHSWRRVTADLRRDDSWQT